MNQEDKNNELDLRIDQIKDRIEEVDERISAQRSILLFKIEEMNNAVISLTHIVTACDEDIKATDKEVKKIKANLHFHI